MKNRDGVCRKFDGFNTGHVLPRSVLTLSPMPYFVRTSSQSEPSLRSTNMCSSNWRSANGTLQPPRSVQVFPLSLETIICALLSCSRHFEIGSTHSPDESMSGLHIITPSPMRRGCDHVGCAASGSAVSMHHTPSAASRRPFSICAQKKNSRPSGDAHSSGSKLRTGPPASGSTVSTSFHVAPSSLLVESTT